MSRARVLGILCVLILGAASGAPSRVDSGPAWFADAHTHHGPQIDEAELSWNDFDYFDRHGIRA